MISVQEEMIHRENWIAAILRTQLLRGVVL